MRQRTLVRAVGFMGLLGVVVALATACSSGVSQKDYDAVKQQLGTKDQEIAAVKQQLTTLQQQVQPAAPQEPKRLEAKLTIEMGETSSDMFFATPEGAKGGPFKVQAGKTVGIHLVNKSADKTHEILAGQKIKLVDGKQDGYEVNLFEKAAADVFVYPSGKKIEIGGGEFEEVEASPGADLWLRVVFPPELKGEWEIGCFVQEAGAKGHYDQGMHAKLIIE